MAEIGFIPRVPPVLCAKSGMHFYRFRDHETPIAMLARSHHVIHSCILQMLRDNTLYVEHSSLTIYAIKHTSIVDRHILLRNDLDDLLRDHTTCQR